MLLLSLAITGLVCCQVQNITWPNQTNDIHAELAYLHNLEYVGLNVANHPYEPVPVGFESPRIKNPHPKAVSFLNGLSLEEKIQMVTGTSHAACSGEISLGNQSDFRFCAQDGPAGPRAVRGTSGFCPELTLAATWDRELVKQHSEAMADENRGKGIHLMLGPVSGGPQGRSAYNGRLFENYGSDPVLTGELTKVAVSAIQSRGVQTSAKHFIAYEQETFRHPGAFAPSSLDFPWSYLPFPAGTQFQIDSIVGDRAVHEVYTWAFADAIRGGTSAVMCGYNRINGTQACQNSHTLSKILKTELDFQGYVISDWFAVERTKDSILAGLDMDQPGNDPSAIEGELWGDNLLKMVKNGTVPENRIDDAILRILTPYYSLGQDEGYPPVSFNSSTYDRQLNPYISVRGDHRNIIRDVATDATVLLKNSGALPLRNDSSLGLFGTDAGPSPYGPNCGMLDQCPIGSKNNGTVTSGGGSGASTSEYVITPLDAITRRVIEHGGGVAFDLDDYGYASPPNSFGYSNFNATMESLDTAIVFVSLQSREGLDLSTMDLANGGNELVKQVASKCNNTIVVIHATNPVVISEWIDHPNVTAVLNAFVPGEQSGNSLVPVLFGDVSPSGKLPFTMAKNESDYIKPLMEPKIDPTVRFDDELLVDYRRFDDMDIEPLFPFGFGMSYTNFDYSNFMFHSNISSGWHFSNTSTNQLYDVVGTAEVTVTNSGNVTGSEVVQIYLSYPDSAGEPPKVLRGFEKLRNIKPGQNKTAKIPLTRKSFSIWDVSAQSWTVPSGSYIVSAAAHSRDLRLNQTLTI